MGQISSKEVGTDEGTASASDGTDDGNSLGLAIIGGNVGSVGQTPHSLSGFKARASWTREIGTQTLTSRSLKCKQTKIPKTLLPKGTQATIFLQLSGRGGRFKEGEFVGVTGEGIGGKVGSGTGAADGSLGTLVGG